MKYLLFSGTTSTGKTGSIYRLANTLTSQGFTVKDGNIPPLTGPLIDFFVVLEGLNNKGIKTIILINSATDEPDIIINLRQQYDALGYSVDIFISSVRDPDWWVRTFFFNTFPIDLTKDFLIEIPMGRINAQRNDYAIALAWYQQQIDIMALHTLRNQPYNI